MTTVSPVTLIGTTTPSPIARPIAPVSPAYVSAPPTVNGGDCVDIPAKTYRPAYCVLPEVLIESASWSSSLAIASRAVCDIVPFEPCRSRSRTRCASSFIWPSAVSVVSSHAVPSLTFVWYCLFAARPAR